MSGSHTSAHPIIDQDVRTGVGYLAGPTRAWFAFVMTLALMIFDHVDRQVIVALFPAIKAAVGRAPSCRRWRRSVLPRRLRSPPAISS